jgi:hypothetical protein
MHISETSMNPVLQQIDDWLMAHREVETDHGGDGQKYLGFEVERNNRYENVLFSLKDDTVLAWYADPSISGDEIATSEHGDQLDTYLLRVNETVSLGRWSRTITGALLFDVSVPIKGEAPPSWVLSQIYDVACDAFDLMISRVRLLLEHGLTIEEYSSKVYTDCINFTANDPAVLLRMETLGLVGGEAATAIRKIMNLPTNTWSESLQEQTREALMEMRGTPDGCIHFKHKSMGSGTVRVVDLANDQLILAAKASSRSLQFQNVQALIDAGWVID